MDYPLVKACVDLSAIQYNIHSLKQVLSPACRFMAVVKADGYGHGAVRVAQKALESGADWLGVARFHEAVTLREAGILAPVLVFGYVPWPQVPQALALDVTLTAYGFEMAAQLSLAAEQLGQKVRTHLKVDTGMGRVGLRMETDVADTAARDRVLKEIDQIFNLPGLDLQGIYTHFAAADLKDKAYTHMQIDLFSSLLADLKKAGLAFEISHAANSAGIIEFSHAQFDMVRAGISLYGLYPSREVDRSRVSLRPAMTLKSIVTSVRTLPKGAFVSYGMTHETHKKTRLASIPIGYADGFSRQFSSNASFLVKGRRAQVVGRVCMDQTMVDVGDHPDVVPGDEVVIIGTQGKETIGADELADQSRTINYEIVSALTARVERIYTESGEGSG